MPGLLSDQNPPLMLHTLSHKHISLCWGSQIPVGFLEQESDPWETDLGFVESLQLVLVPKALPLCPGPSLHPHGLSQPPKGISCPWNGNSSRKSISLCARASWEQGIPFPNTCLAPRHIHADFCAQQSLELLGLLLSSAAKKLG